MLAAGGTGGHLFPAFALAEELGRRGWTVDLVTDMRGDRYGTGFPARAVYQVPSATLAGKSPAAIAKTGLTLARGVMAALKLMRQVRPAVVVGFGGYPTFPPLLAARQQGIPTMLHEQNAVLGRANKMLAGRVDRIATSFETTRFLEGPLSAKAHFTGNPVRDVVIHSAGAPYPQPASTEPFQLLVFGGSQGARFFSDAVPPALATLPAALKSRLNVVQQAREEDVDRVTAAYAEAGITAEVAPFFKDLPARMAASHLVIARAGASTVAELTVIGRPGILVPLPHSLDNDQLQNATRLAESGGAWCIEQKDLSPERLAGDIARLMGDGAALSAAAACAKRQGRPDAVSLLAGLVEELAGAVEASALTSTRAV
jgi:UDP-N-acetylglucosamine--N-acetylmuramyl-(pentapeptide) pyrophosphoryl-undecaprenol N-acetylglucosamine transferase